MANITLVNPVPLDPAVQPALPWQIEQGQFLGMINDLAGAGNDVTFVDALGGLLSADETARQVIKLRPDVVGVSGYVSRDNTILEFDRAVLRQIRGALPNVKTWLGGPIAIHKSTREAAIEALQPDITVVGEGEIPIKALIATGFAAAGLESDPRVILESYMGAAILRARESVDLDSINYTRPAQWPDYIIRTLGWQRFCLGGCKFCSGARRRPTYVSPGRAYEELAYLMAKDSWSFLVSGPEFTQDSESATVITEEMVRQRVRNINFSFEARIPEFSATMRDFMPTWAELGQTNSLIVYLGLESAVPDILLHIGKVQTEDEAWQYLPNLLDILDKAPTFKYLLAWMLLSPKSTPATVLFDLLIVRAILEKYPNVDMNQPSVTNNMIIAPGMRFFDEGLADWAETAAEPIRALHTHMARLSVPGKMGPFRKWLAGKIARKATGSNESALSQALSQAFSQATKTMNVKRLGGLAQFLLSNMKPDEARHALAEARRLAEHFGDWRVLELFDSQADSIKGQV